MGATFVMSYPAADWEITAGKHTRSGVARGTGGNPRAALREWIALADAISAAGGRILVADPPPTPTAVAAPKVAPPDGSVAAQAEPAELGPTGLPYTADWGALIRRGDQPLFLLSKGSTGHRAADAELAASVFAAAGVPVVALDCAWGGRGDLVHVGPGRYVYVAGARSDKDAGARVAAELGTTVRWTEARVADPFTFGDEVVAMLRNKAQDGTMIVHEAGLVGRAIPELRSMFAPVEVISVDAEDAAAGACTALDVNGTVILPAGLSTNLRANLIRRGLQLVELELPELHGRGGGGPHALVNELVGFVIGPSAPEYSRARDRIVALVDAYPEAT